MDPLDSLDFLDSSLAWMALRSAMTTSRFRVCKASMACQVLSRGLTPSLVLAVGSAPASSRSRTSFKSPSAAAWRGVEPFG